MWDLPTRVPAPSGDIGGRLRTTASRTLATWRRRTRTGSATSGSMMIRTSACSSPRWTEPPDGRRRSGCGRGSEHISASLLANGCSTWAAASGRQRSRSPRISAKAVRSSASTRPRACCASPVPTPEVRAVACASPSAMRAPSTEPDDSFDAARSERTLQWLADPAAAVAEMVRVVRPGGRVSLIDTDWSTFTIDVGDDKLAALVRDGMRTERHRPSNVGRRLHDLVGAAGCVPLARTEATQTWTTWDPDESPAPLGCFSMESLADDLVASDSWRPPTAIGSCRRSTTPRDGVNS